MNKILLPIIYAINLIKNPKTGQKNCSAAVVERGTKTTESIAQELAKSTTVTETDCKAIIAGFMEFSMTHVAEGYRVCLDGFGSFYPTLKNKPAAVFKDWTPSRIAGANVRFLPSQRFKDLLAGATFTKGLSRKNQNQTMADVDSALEAALSVNEPEEPQGD